jgi:cell division transport system permease protein
MMHPTRYVKQLGRHVRQEKTLTLGSFLVLAIVLVLIDLFWIGSLTLTRQYHDILKAVRMEIFLSDAVPEIALPVIESSLRTLDGVADVSFVSKDEAALILENELGPGILEGLDSNPLPRSFVISFDRTKSLSDLDAFGAQLMRLEGVETVEFGRPWIEKVELIGRKLRAVGYAVGGVILVIVLLTMANTNRLTARSKSRDFFQLKLLGAGPSFLVYPFVAEGFLSAFLAAGLGWASLFYVNTQVTFATLTIVFPRLGDIFVYALLAGVAGMAGAYLGIRRLLAS